MSCKAAADADSSEKIITLERTALDRWGKGDPGGYLEIIAPDETYFDPLLDQRLAGLDVLRKYLAPFTGRIHIDHYEMINPIVQRSGDTAILTFNLVDTGIQADSDKTTTVRWNSTEVISIDRWTLEDRTFPLVLHEAGTEGRTLTPTSVAGGNNSGVFYH